LFRSSACRDEFQKFGQRERVLGRTDLILPVYYISAREMDDPGLRAADEMAVVLASRQLADWRELRFEPFTSPRSRKAIAKLASRMRDTFWRLPTALGERVAGQGQTAESSESSAELGERPSATGPVTTERPTLVVDAYQRGDFATVSAAIQAAQPGDRILVRPGLYEECLIVDKPLEILGDGAVADIVIRAYDADALLFRATVGRVANLTLRQAGGEEKWFGVHATKGRLDLEGCDISSQSLACVAIRDGADPRLRRNRIHDGKANGVLVCDGGMGVLEDNDIAANGMGGVAIRTGGNPTLRGNRIHDSKTIGVHVHDGGIGVLENNDIVANGSAGVLIRTGGNPTLRGNRIHDGKASGVHVHDDGIGTLEDNDIVANRLAGVRIRTGGNPTLRGNRINSNAHEAVWICENGRGVIENNDLTGNKRGSWNIADDCKANVTRTGNKE
jgi:parallel beta-helix repeat protein